MSLIAVKVIEPGGDLSAELVEDRQRVDRVIPDLVRALRLPEGPHYRLVDLRSDAVLRGGDTLRHLRFPEGGVLRLEVVRDRVLRAVLDRLYGQAKRWARDRMSDQVEAHLDAIRRLDPDYPDRDGLARGLSRDGLPRSGSRPTPPPLPRAPVATPPEAAPEPKESGCSGGCVFTLIVLVIGAVLVGNNWEDIERWAHRTFGAPRSAGSEGTITAGSGGRIEIVDHNSVLDFAYELYLNNQRVGAVRNPAGGTTRYDVRFDSGRNAVELRYLDDNRAVDTKLVIRINGGEFEREFIDDAKAARRSFEWILDGIDR